MPIAQINARHSSSTASKLPSDDMGGLEPKLFLAVGARVMLTRNRWTEKGLCNGSMGTISDIVFRQGDQPPALPIAVIVQFDSTYTGPSFRSDLPLLLLLLIIFIQGNSVNINKNIVINRGPVDK